jgi:hypothetical protein
LRQLTAGDYVTQPERGGLAKGLWAMKCRVSGQTTSVFAG